MRWAVVRIAPRTLTLALALLSVLLAGGVGWAQDAAVRPPGVAPADQVAALARQLRCPICEGYDLWDCPLPVCAQMRQHIADRLAAGWSEQDILQEFVELYGPQVLLAPPRRGLYLLAWGVPPMVLAVALAAAAVVLRQWRHVPVAEPSASRDAAPGAWLSGDEVRGE